MVTEILLVAIHIKGDLAIGIAGLTHPEYPDLLLSSPHVSVSVGDNFPPITLLAAHSSKKRVIWISCIMFAK